MTNKQDIKCTQCKSEVHPLDLFSGNVCLPCYAKEHENDTPEQMFAVITSAFGGKR
jgi:hypothetical protein